MLTLHTVWMEKMQNFSMSRSGYTFTVRNGNYLTKMLHTSKGHVFHVLHVHKNWLKISYIFNIMPVLLLSQSDKHSYESDKANSYSSAIGSICPFAYLFKHWRVPPRNVLRMHCIDVPRVPESNVLWLWAE